MDKYQTLREKDNPSNNVYPNIKAQNIPSSAISASKVASGAITSTKIAVGAVQQSHLSPNAVSTSAVEDGSITSSKIANNAITNAKIANGAITGAKIDPASVQAVHCDITKVALSSLIDDITTIAELVSRLKTYMRLPFARLYWDYANAYADIDISVFELIGTYRITYSKSDLSGFNTFTTDADAVSFITTAQDIKIEYLE